MENQEPCGSCYSPFARRKTRIGTVSGSGLNRLPKLSAYTPALSNPCSSGSSNKSIFAEGFVLRCFQNLSRKRVAALLVPCKTTGEPEAPKACSSRTKASFHSDLHASPVDIIPTVSQRCEPSSRSLLIGEHPHPWPLMHGQDRKSRRRCSKPRRRYELSGETTLLSPE
jgi:hypothetical protein